MEAAAIKAKAKIMIPEILFNSLEEYGVTLFLKMDEALLKINHQNVDPKKIPSVKISERRRRFSLDSIPNIP